MLCECVVPHDFHIDRWVVEASEAQAHREAPNRSEATHVARCAHAARNEALAPIDSVGVARHHNLSLDGVQVSRDREEGLLAAALQVHGVDFRLELLKRDRAVRVGGSGLILCLENAAALLQGETLESVMGQVFDGVHGLVVGREVLEKLLAGGLADDEVVGHGVGGVRLRVRLRFAMQ